jgi:hypothetical protein
MSEPTRKLDVTDIEILPANSQKRNAEHLRKASFCVRCNHKFELGEPIWHDVFELDANACYFCALDFWGPDWRDYVNVSPCDCCKRPVFWDKEAATYGIVTQVVRYAHYKRVLCTKHCENAFYRGRPNRLLLAPPVLRCETCTQSFSSKRTDAKHCSPACKQKAYRQRKAKNLIDSLTQPSLYVRYGKNERARNEAYPSEVGLDAREVRGAPGRCAKQHSASRARRARNKAVSGALGAAFIEGD